MKCPKCGYHSFEYLENCKKCRHDLREHKVKYHLRGLQIPVTAAMAEASMTAVTENLATVDSAEDELNDFGFDFLAEDDKQVEENQDRIALDSDDEDISLDHMFDLDSEAVPADPPAEKKDKPEKGPDFAF